ncbi:hypothetical protein [Cohnella cellulosilytica]|uniref:LexA family protein n=1 Tax=Cohnella cellulosilytica TaxID=986710 RepID=UPI00360FC262
MSKASQALTRVEAQALEIIKLFINENGYAPSIRELADAMNYNSSSTAFNVVERLRKKGAIATGRNGPRTIRVLRENGDERIDKIVEQCGQIGEYDDEEFTRHNFWTISRGTPKVSSGSGSRRCSKQALGNQ